MKLEFNLKPRAKSRNIQSAKRSKKFLRKKYSCFHDGVLNSVKNKKIDKVGKSGKVAVLSKSALLCNVTSIQTMKNYFWVLCLKL